MLDPIELYTDTQGLAEVFDGMVGKGDLIPKAYMIHQHNPELIARVAFEKSRRRSVMENNWRQFYDCFQRETA